MFLGSVGMFFLGLFVFAIGVPGHRNYASVGFHHLARVRGAPADFFVFFLKAGDCFGGCF